MQQVLTPSGITPLPSPSLYGTYVGVANTIFHAAPYGPYPIVPVTKVNDPMQSRSAPKRNHDGESELLNIRCSSLLLTGTSESLCCYQSYGTC